MSQQTVPSVSLIFLLNRLHLHGSLWSVDNSKVRQRYSSEDELAVSSRVLQDILDLFFGALTGGRMEIEVYLVFWWRFAKREFLAHSLFLIMFCDYERGENEPSMGHVKTN